MEKLEFKNYGLEELSSREVQETEGGKINANFWFGLAFGLLFSLIVGNAN